MIKLSEDTEYIVKSLMYYRNAKIKGCTILSKETIHCYDLTFVLKGSMTYIVNGEKYVINENDAILLPPKSVRQRLASDQFVHFVAFNFNIFPTSTLPLPIHLKNIVTKDIRLMLEINPHEYMSSMYHHRDKLSNILNYILYEIIDIFPLLSKNATVMKIERFIEENITKKITLDMICKRFHFTKEYLSYLFKKNTGKTLIGYVNERKMRIAKDMIQYGEIPLNEIAERLGYSNYSYFSRLFSKQFNAPPHKFR